MVGNPTPGESMPGWMEKILTDGTAVGKRVDLQFYLDRQTTHLISLATGYARNLGLFKIPPILLDRERFVGDQR